MTQKGTRFYYFGTKGDPAEHFLTVSLVAMETGGISASTLRRRRDDIDESSTEVLEATLP